ncbi:HAMP domain-containing sensor histidine kinase [Streptomyces sp. AK08-02]|uniref:sensor histidine kinase n=1 Tax=Streptomyces sp. AK08-02 TaxID=3028654 RepID=UPI0029B6A0F0|nr:HAMP domain-containing sensor histidine kinase [Streptomyces sp. AK08-02]MDX3748500.1 HAMP domain-containing sensor histidine kinase [Streptomyces sp. AK08-02]
MPFSRFPAYRRSRVRLRRIEQRMSLRDRLVLSHVMVLLLALVAMAAISALIEVWLGFDDIEGDVVLRIGLLFGGAAAFPASLALSRFLLRPLDRVRAATRRLAEGHYDDVLELPSEPGLAALVQDVNTLAAALADTQRRRARLISEVAHEMRTPITILRGQIEGIADGIFTPDEAMFASLADDLDRLQRLAGDLSSLSRSEEGAFDLHREPADVAMLARRTAERLRPQYDDQTVALAVDADTPVGTFCDPDRITQILVNLLGNALAAVDPDGRVVLSVHTEAAPVRHVIVRVMDDGIGIAAPDLERIFHRFERLGRPGRPAAAGGSGIGLTIARGIARAHGGDITAESAGLGRGATFTLRLPQEHVPGADMPPDSR